MYIVNKLVAIIAMLSSCATAMTMSALFTIYVAIALDKGYKARFAELLQINRRSTRKRLAKAANRRRIIVEDRDKDFFVISVGKKVRTKRGLEGKVVSLDSVRAGPDPASSSDAAVRRLGIIGRCRWRLDVLISRNIPNDGRSNDS